MIRRAGLMFLALLLAAPVSGAAAAGYPDHPVRIVVPFPAGGSNDILARIVAQKLTELWGEQVVVDNRGGANGNVGADIVAKAPADGYSLLLTTPGPLSINAALYTRMPFDAATDFAPVALIASVPLVLMVTPALPAHNLAELIALAKAKPGGLNFASSGNGSTNHLAGELLKHMAGIDIVHVPYRGAAPAMNDLVAGQIPMMFDNMPGALAQVQSKTVRAIAVASARRAAAMPDVPTLAESGVPGFEATAWFGLVAPAATPAPVIEKLAGTLAIILKDRAVIQRFAELGAEPGSLTPAEFKRFIDAETAKWTAVVKESGARID